MRFQCNHCRALLELDDAVPGEVVQCPTCLSPVTVPESVTAPQAILGDFVIRDTIGIGGMGTVYLAHQITLDRDVALKVLRPEFGNDTNFIQNFINEARAAASLNHPNIVQAVAVNCDEGLWYFAMEYVNGKTLQQHLEQDGRIPSAQALDIIGDVIAALKYAWNERHIVHRDIKPDNIIITADGHAKLADLGLAKKVTELNADGCTELYGTPQYLAPELSFGTAPNIVSDIYSLGATLYHAVSGQFPFAADTPEEIVRLHVSAPLVPLCNLSDDIHPALSQLVDIMMSKAPEQRYQTYEELEADLNLVRNDEMPQRCARQDKTAETADSKQVKKVVRKLSRQTTDSSKVHLKPADKSPAIAQPSQPNAITQKSGQRTRLISVVIVFVVLLIAVGTGGICHILRKNKAQETAPAAGVSENVTETSEPQSQETATENEQAEKLSQEEAEKELAEAQAKAEREKELAEAQAKAEAEREREELRAREEARKEKEREARERAEAQAREQAERKKREEQEHQAAVEAVSAEKSRRMDIVMREIANRDFSDARQIFFPRMDKEEPADKAWRNQWEQALSLAEAFWDHLKDAAPKLTGKTINEFAMKALRHKLSRNNLTERAWTIADMSNDLLTLRCDFTERLNDEDLRVSVDWKRRLQDLRASQLEELAKLAGPLPGKSEDESRQALGLYLLVCGIVPAETAIAQYDLRKNWPLIAESGPLPSPNSYIACQLECLKERAQRASEASDVFRRILISLQAYSLGNALYLTFPQHRNLYAADVQETIKPLFTPNKQSTQNRQP